MNSATRQSLIDFIDLIVDRLDLDTCECQLEWSDGQHLSSCTREADLDLVHCLKQDLLTDETIV